MTDVRPALFNFFREETGCGFFTAKDVLQKCDSPEAAVTYLLMKGDACLRFRTVDGKRIPWTDQDYITYANANPSNRVDFSEVK